MSLQTKVFLYDVYLILFWLLEKNEQVIFFLLQYQLNIEFKSINIRKYSTDMDLISLERVTVLKFLVCIIIIIIEKRVVVYSRQCCQGLVLLMSSQFALKFYSYVLLKLSNSRKYSNI